MYDINFFQNSYNLKKKIVSGKITKDNIDDISAELSQLRKKDPIIYNIETTNYCNMKCVMCPKDLCI